MYRKTYNYEYENSTYHCTQSKMDDPLLWKIGSFTLTEKKCNEGYTKSLETCGTKPSGMCAPIDSIKSVKCNFSCTWQGDYDASCNKRFKNGCPDGYTADGSYCYKCPEGELKDGTCYSTKQENYTYYKYTITIKYYK